MAGAVGQSPKFSFPAGWCFSGGWTKQAVEIAIRWRDSRAHHFQSLSAYVRCRLRMECSRSVHEYHWPIIGQADSLRTDVRCRLPRSGRGGRRFKSCHSDHHLVANESLAPTVSPTETNSASQDCFRPFGWGRTKSAEKSEPNPKRFKKSAPWRRCHWSSAREIGFWKALERESCCAVPRLLCRFG